MPTCSVCKINRETYKYSKSQLKKGSNRKCNYCTSNILNASKQPKNFWIKCKNCPMNNSSVISDFIKIDTGNIMALSKVPSRWSFTLKCHIYNTSLNKWTKPVEDIVTLNYNMVYSICIDYNNGSIYILTADNNKASILKFKMNNLSKPIETLKLNHDFDKITRNILSLFVNDELHLIQNNTHYIWNTIENTLKTTHQFSTDCTIFNLKFQYQSILLHLQSHNALLLVYFNCVWYYSLEHRKWTQWNVITKCYVPNYIKYNRNFNDAILDIDYKMTDDERYIIMFAEDVIYIFDIENKQIDASKIEIPGIPPNEEMQLMKNSKGKIVIMNRNKVLISGLFNSYFGTMRILPIEVLNLILAWLDKDAMVYLIYDRKGHGHYQTNIESILLNNEESGGMHLICSVCGRARHRSQYSKTQMKKVTMLKKCKLCVQNRKSNYN
eukprot:464982_1